MICVLIPKLHELSVPHLRVKMIVCHIVCNGMNSLVVSLVLECLTDESLTEVKCKLRSKPGASKLEVN